MRRFSGIFFLFLAGLIFHAQQTSGATKVYFSEYEDLANSNWAKANDFAERLKRLARQTMPYNGQSYQTVIVLAEKNKPQTFHAEFDGRKTVRIQIPSDYRLFLHDMSSTTRLCSWFLLANAGLPPEHAQIIQNTWFVTGLTRKAIHEMHFVDTPFSSYYPAAYTLESHALAPKLKKIAGTPLLPTDAAPRMIYEEYCELLVLICAKNKLFKEDNLHQIILETVRSFPNTDHFRIFLNHMAPSVIRRETGTKKLPEQEQADFMEQWFRRELSRALTWDLLPASVQRIEQEYRKAVTFQYRRRETGSELTGKLVDLAEQWDQMEQPEKLHAEVLRRLILLGQIVPPDLVHPLSALRFAVIKFRTARTPAEIAEMKNAEAKFFAALENHIAIDRFLNRTERESLPPGTRFYLTRWMLWQKEMRESIPVTGIDRLLEKSSNTFKGNDS